MTGFGKLLSIVVAIGVVGVFAVLLATQRSGNAGSSMSIEAITTPAPDQEPTLERAVGLALRRNPAAPPIGAVQAVSVALEHEGITRPPLPPKVSSWVADRQYPARSSTEGSQRTTPVTDELIPLRDRPVWIVTLEGTEMAISSPAGWNQPPLWRSRKDVVIDATTGEWLFTSEEALEPVSTAGSTDDPVSTPSAAR